MGRINRPYKQQPIADKLYACYCTFTKSDLAKTNAASI